MHALTRIYEYFERQGPQPFVLELVKSQTSRFVVVLTSLKAAKEHLPARSIINAKTQDSRVSHDNSAAERALGHNLWFLGFVAAGPQREGTIRAAS